MLIASHQQISRVPDHYNPEIKSQDIVTTAIVIDLNTTQVKATIQHNQDNGLISMNIQGSQPSLSAKEMNLIFDDIYKFVAVWVEGQ